MKDGETRSANDPRQRFRARAVGEWTDADAAIKKIGTGNKEEDRARTDELAGRIAQLQDVFYAARRRKLLVILQGMDTSGKDGTIKGVFGRIDPLGIRTVAFKAPSSEELERDFLWRVHRQVPGTGEFVIFNRSHYEDVLITWVHGKIDDAERERRLAHIRDFERLLTETGTVVLKFFLHISKDEQKKRLMKRLDNPEKHWKFDPQDLSERKHWERYQEAYRTAIELTDSDHAPWYVIPADSKPHRNLAIATILHRTLEDLALTYPPPRPEYESLRVE